MPQLPERIESVDQLDELLSRPSAPLVQWIGTLDGDLLILGAGGKVGPTLARMARRAIDEAGGSQEVLAVDQTSLDSLRRDGIHTLRCDLLDPEAVSRLPRVPNVMFMAGRKFGSTGNESLTWAINVLIPHVVARTFTESRIVVFSTGCVYPLMTPESGGATEDTPPDAIGEYAQSCLGRERVFEYFSRTVGEKVLLFRLNYAVELRYGVLFDIAWKVWRGEPVDLTTGHVNVLWQGDVCDRALRALSLADSPPAVLNVTGPETLSVRELAQAFGREMHRPVRFSGEESGRAYLSNASCSLKRYGPPSVPPEQLIRWIAHWIRIGGPNLGKPTHFEVQNGKF